MTMGVGEEHIIEAMRPEDIEAVMQIEAAAHPLPWSPRVFLEELSRPQAHIDLLRRRGDGLVVAFINFWAVLDEVHLLNVATHPAERRKGHARTVMAHMLDWARQQRCRLVMLEVRRSNDAARALYGSLGFVSVGVRPGYYADNREDALLMNLELPPVSAPDDAP